MTAMMREETPEMQDQRYVEGTNHLQFGRWHEALRCFESLAKDYPTSQPIQWALNEARFKAGLESTTSVRAKEWIIAWRPVIAKALVVIVVVALLIEGFVWVKGALAPTMAQAQVERQQAQLLVEGKTFLEAGDLTNAEARFRALLAQSPDNAEATEGLTRIAEQRATQALYDQAVALQKAGDLEGAMQRLTQLTVSAPGYRDVAQRIAAIKGQQNIEGLLAEAQADYAAGRWSDALLKFQQVKAANSSYRADVVSARLFDINMRLGREIIESRTPDLAQVPQALAYFGQALALQPRNSDALLERRLLNLYLDGQAKFQQNSWEEAVTSLASLYEQRPRYLGGAATRMLYESYIKLGDQQMAGSDLNQAYEFYRKAAELPVPDNSLARGRMAALAPKLTPTATPLPTATPSPTMAPTSTPGPTAVVTPKPLATHRGQIVFFSNQEEKAGLWVMDADGNNRQYLGESRDLRKQYDALVEQARLSPDGRYKLFVKNTGKSAQVFMTVPPSEQWGQLPPKQVSMLTGTSYDPVWAPDGSKVVFVSQEDSSDDIWITNPDGTDNRNLTRNSWEWDKHPSWSPDSKRIVFWSNREGHMQIYIMDADGRNAHNISKSEWDEFDPIWIR